MFVVLYAPHFVAGVVFLDGRITRCAPIIQWMKKQNWTLHDIRVHCQKKKWHMVEFVDDVLPKVE